MWYNRCGDYMSILVLNGSSRKSGNISKFINELQHRVDGIEVINTYEINNIEFCMSCDYCKEHSVCVKKDAINDILDKIINADSLIVATPIYFETFPASLKLVIDRMQPLYYNVERNLNRLKKKKCYTILVAGQDRKGQFDHITKILNVIYRQLNGKMMGEIFVGSTDIVEVNIEKYKNEIDKIIDEINEV